MEYVDVYELHKVSKEYTGPYREFCNYNMYFRSAVEARYENGDEESTEGYVTTSKEPVVSFISNTRDPYPPYGVTTTERLVVMSPLLKEVLNYKHTGDEDHKHLVKDNKALDSANRGHIKEIEHLKYKIDALTSSVEKVKSVGWLVRLKWVLTGVKV